MPSVCFPKNLYSDMILTVTPDPVLDLVFLIDEWLPGLPMHADETVISVGGKGLDASVALRHLGVDTVGLCFLAGNTGERLLERVQEYGINPRPVWVSGETRSAHIIAERAHARHSHVFSGGISIGVHQLDQLLVDYQEQLKTADWVLTGGVFPDSLPPYFFHTIATLAQCADVPILVDSHSQYMENALPAGLDIIKMNQVEFEWTFGNTIDSFSSLQRAGETVFKQYKPQALVVTRGSQGLIAFTHQGIYSASPPELKVVNAAGAGDAASAAIAWRRSLGDDWSQTLRWACAASAAVVLTRGTADLQERDARDLLPQIHIERLGELE
jgi:1-phosphofructokinase family hexose kinase